MPAPKSSPAGIRRGVMSRFFPAAALALLAVNLPAAYAQTAPRSQHNAFPAGVIEGRVLDADQTPVAGAVVSVVGRAIAVATTDRDGCYTLKDLPFGPYILSVRSRGYWQSRGRTVQLSAANVSAPAIQLERASASKAQAAPQADPPASTQLAGFGVLDVPPLAVADSVSDASGQAGDAEGGSETAWRLRH